MFISSDGLATTITEVAATTGAHHLVAALLLLDGHPTCGAPLCRLLLPSTPHDQCHYASQAIGQESCSGKIPFNEVMMSGMHASALLLMAILRRRRPQE